MLHAVIAGHDPRDSTSIPAPVPPVVEAARQGATGDLTGVRSPALLQAYGLREIVCGVGILTSPRPAGWMWARVAGDAMDLATLGGAMLDADEKDRTAALIAGAAVAGVTALDTLCATTLSAAAAMEG